MIEPTTSFLPAIISLLIGIIFLVILTRFNKEIDEFAEPIEQYKPKKMTLTDWIVSIGLLIVIILILVLILFIIGDKLMVATLDCYNCTGLN
jgi:uncharacterized membrane protein YdbT with pleckstrin-like domain